MTEIWGATQSVFSTQLDAPPLNEPLSGSVPLTVKVTKIIAGSTGTNVGETWPDTWNFSATCQTASCTLTDKGDLISGVGNFTAKLTPSDGGYQGQAAHVQFSHCAGTNSYNTATVQIYPDTGGVTNGSWNSWHGTLTLAYPGQTVGDLYCSAGDYVFALTGTGS